MNLQQTITQLLTNPKITQASIFDDEHGCYIAIQYVAKNKQEHFITCSPDDLYLLLGGFTISSIGKYEYVRLHEYTNSKRYMHQNVVECPVGFVVHHQGHSLDNRREFLQVLPRDVHSRFHRLQSLQRSSTIN